MFAIVLLCAQSHHNHVFSEIQQELKLHDTESVKWLSTAEESGKTITVPGIECYNCGGDHLNIDCPDDQEISSSALALPPPLVQRARHLIGPPARRARRTRGSPYPGRE